MGVSDMRRGRSDFLSTLIWPALAAALVAGGLAFLSAHPSTTDTAGLRDREPVPASREAMRMLHDEHDRVLDQADRQRAQTEQKAAEDEHAFEQAREQARLAAAAEAAAQEAARKLAEQRAAEGRRVADASPVKEIRKPKPEAAAASPPGAPLDIVPAGGESAPVVRKPRGPIETVVAKVGDVADEIKNKAVGTVTGIKDWFSAAGDKLLGRDNKAGLPASRLSLDILDTTGPVI